MKNPIQLPTILLFAMLLIVQASCGKDDSFGGGNNPIYDGPEDTIINHSFITTLNQIRTEGCTCGSKKYPATHKLSWNTMLEASAQKHSADMEAKDFFSHTGTGNTKFSERISAQGYEFLAVGENIAKNYTNIETVIQAWVDSPDHCANLMNSNFSEVGIAQSGIYWTMDLGRPK